MRITNAEVRKLVYALDKALITLGDDGYFSSFGEPLTREVQKAIAPLRRKLGVKLEDKDIPWYKKPIAVDRNHGIL